MNFEIICSDAIDNSIMSIKGMGHLIIKNNCVAKSNQHILLGTFKHNLNNTFVIKTQKIGTELLDVAGSHSIGSSLEKVISNINTVQNMTEILNITELRSQGQPHYIHIFIIYSFVCGILIITVCLLLCKLKNCSKNYNKNIDIVNLKNKDESKESKKVELKDCKVNPYEEENCEGFK